MRQALAVDVAAMVAQYTAGASVRDVAASAWVSYGTAYRRLRATGVPMRPRNQSKGSTR